MHESPKKQIFRYWLLYVPPILVLLCILLYKPLLAVEKFAADYIFHCVFFDVTGFYCPGCGGTRSLTALLHGHFLLALHENPGFPLLVLLGILLYVEKAAAVLGRQIRLIPRSRAFWITICSIHLIWAILRNFVPILQPFS